MQENTTVQIAKALNEEKKLATYVVLVPEQEDLHNHIYSHAVVEDACISFNLFCQKSNLCHLVETDLFDVVQSWVTPVDMVLNDTFIKKGAWLATIRANSDTLWEDIKNGNFVGLSIGADVPTKDLAD